MKLTPHDYQEEQINLALAQIGTSNGCLIGSEMGNGKTLIACEVMLRANWGINGQALIIAPPDTHAQWAHRLEEQSNGEVVVRVCNGTTKVGKDNFEAFMAGDDGVFAAGAEFIRAKDWEMKEIDGKRKSVRINFYRRTVRHRLQVVVLDEAHSLSNKKSKTRATIWSIKANYRMAMSGTWARNDPANMWSVAKYVWPGDNPETGEPYIEGSYWDWAERYLTMQTIYGPGGKPLLDSRGNPVRKLTGEKNPGEFVSTLPAYRRLENEDRVPEPEIIMVDPTPEQAAQLAELEEDLLTWVTNWQGDREPLVADIPAVLLVRMRQACIAALSFDENGDVTMAPDAASAKLAPLRWLIEEHWKGQPVAIYTDSKVGAKFIEARMQAAGVDARAWTGDLSKKERAELKAAFIAGEFPYIICTIQSFGVGLDGFQQRCNKVVWISEANGDPALNDQAIARFFRPGRTMANGGFEHVKILMKDSPDVQTFETLLSKGMAIRAAMTLAA